MHEHFELQIKRLEIRKSSASIYMFDELPNYLCTGNSKRASNIGYIFMFPHSTGLLVTG